MELKLTLAFLMLCCTCAHGQSIAVKDFKSDPSAPIVDVTDFEGAQCAAVRIPTSDRSFCFEAGLAGIVDVAYTSSDITLYIPACAHVLSISHRAYGVLRDWIIPATLEGGHTYVMRLQCEERKMTPVCFATPLPAGASAKAPRPKPDCGEFSHSFIDISFGFANEEDWADRITAGLSYTYLHGRVGPYVGLNYLCGEDDDQSLSVVGGAALRLTCSSAHVDWQLYGGAGLDIAAAPVFELGTRIDIGGGHELSRWDFGIGCMCWNGEIVPKVSVGYGIWGGGILVTLGLACLAVAAL